MMHHKKPSLINHQYAAVIARLKLRQ